MVTALRGAAAPASRLAIEIALEPRTDDERARRSRLGAAVGSMGEPLQAGLAREDLSGFLADTGWVMASARDPAGVPIDVSPRSTAFVIAQPVLELSATARPTNRCAQDPRPESARKAGSASSHHRRIDSQG